MCELEEKANRGFNLCNLEEEKAEPLTQGRAPSLPSLPHNSQRELPNPALAAPLDTSSPNYQGSEEDKAPKPPQEELREGKRSWFSASRRFQAVTPSKSAPNLSREEGMCFPRGGTLQAAGEVVQLPAPHRELPGSFVGLDPSTTALGISCSSYRAATGKSLEQN